MKEKLVGLIVVSFGLLCVLQVVLNISLRLALYSSFEAIIKNQTEEVKDLKGKLSTINSSFEAIIKNQTEEVEDLKGKLSTIKDLKGKLSTITELSQKGWVYFSHSFYYISSTAGSWQKSRDDCQQRGADLMIINSKAEQDFGRQFKRDTWIGLTDRQREGVWKWVDGTPLDTSYWKAGEPNSYTGTNEDCVEIRVYEKDIGANCWNDIPCSDENYWICEKLEPV